MKPKRFIILKNYDLIVDSKNKNNYICVNGKLYGGSGDSLGTIVDMSDNIYDLKESDDILIVKFDDSFFKNMYKPIFACHLEEYHTPVALLRKDSDGNYVTYTDIVKEERKW